MKSGFGVANSVTGETCQRVLGDEPITTGIAGPEVADDVVGDESRCFGGDHRVSANGASREVTPTRAGPRRDGRQDFSNCWHRDLLAI